MLYSIFLLFYVCRMWSKPFRFQKKSKIALLMQKLSSKLGAEAHLFPDQQVWCITRPASLLHHKACQNTGQEHKEVVSQTSKLAAAQSLSKQKGRSAKKLCPRPANLLHHKACQNKGQEHKEAVFQIRSTRPKQAQWRKDLHFFGSGARVRCHQSRVRCHQYNLNPLDRNPGKKDENAP